MAQISVLHIVNALNVGGMENGLINIINFNANKTIVHSICAMTVIGDAYKRLTNFSGCVYSLRCTGSNRLAFLKVGKLLHKVRPSIVHIRHWGPLPDTMVSLATCWWSPKVVFSYHGKTYSDLCANGELQKMMRRFFLRRSNKIVTLNQAMRKELIADYNLRDINVDVIENGVDTKIFCPVGSVDEKANLRKALQIPVSSFVIGAVGRLDKVKDFSTLVKACALLKNYISNFRLIIVGDGPEYSSLEQEINGLGLGEKIMLPGKSNQVPEYLKSIDIFVQPSLYEGFSNSILEAMSSGVPVLATRVGGNPEIVIDGYSGMLFDPGDAEKLSLLLLRFYQDEELRQNVGQKAREIVEERWTLEKMAKNYEQLYLDLVAS